MLDLRPYQKTACQKIWQSLTEGKNTLLQAPTGSGKSCCVSAIIKRCTIAKPSCKILILLDRELLIRQLSDSIKKFYPELEVGIVCSGISAKKQFNRQVTVASRQTIKNHLAKLQDVDLIILDEAHLARPPREGKEPDQYGKIISHLMDSNQSLLIFGCSATPYRLGNGYIFGENNHPEDHPYFKELAHSITFKELTENGHLAPLVGQLHETEIDLTEVGIVAGEYNIGELSTTMCRYIDTVKEAIDKLASDRRKILVFCVSIEHCEQVADVLDSCRPYHSKLLKMERYGILSDFARGNTRILTSVATLTTGIDISDIDCVVFSRPTMAPALMCQMVGRGLRTHPGKENCLLIDLVGNISKHCPTNNLDNIVVRIPKGVTGEGDCPVKVCEECGELCHSAVRICAGCGYEFPEKTLPAECLPDLTKVEFSQPEPPQTATVDSMTVEEHTSKKSKLKLIKVTLHASMENTFEEIRLYDWICLKDNYHGYATEKGAKVWAEYSNEPTPQTVEEAMFLDDSMRKPSTISVRKNGRFWELLSKDFSVVETFMDSDDDVVVINVGEV